MRKSTLIGTIASFAVLMAASPRVVSNVQPVAPGRDAAEVFISPRDLSRIRSKRKQAKPKKRPNMRLVSKRVRRKHRRAKCR